MKVIDKTKVCYGCKKRYPATSEFYWKCERGSLGLQSRCKECQREYNKRTRHRYSERTKQYNKRYYAGRQDELRGTRRAHNIKRNFGLTLKDYNNMAMEQHGLCAICGLPEKSKHQSGQVRHLAVDHNHNTGKIRGLLCSDCNRAIGFLRADVLGTQNLQRAVEYLQETK